MPPIRFVVFIGVSLAAFILVLNWALRRRPIQRSRWRIAGGLGFVGRLHRQGDWTDGCIAVTNREIEEIWRVVPDNRLISTEP
jgi:hypothetical protein